MINNTNQLKESTREYLNKEWDDETLSRSLGLTLTMKQMNESIPLDDKKSDRNFTHFMNRLEKKVFNSSGKRYGKRIKRFPTLERTNKRFHIHVLIEVPKFSDGSILDKDTYIKLINDCWKKTFFGYKQVHVTELDSQNPRGWGEYITKLPDSEDNRVDWLNVR